MISAADVSFSYDGTPVLAGVGLLADPGETVGLIGPNGSGKTTFLRTLYAARTPRAGLITIDEAPISSLSTLAVARRVGVVARSPHRSSFERYSPDDYTLTVQALTRVGVEHLADRSYNQLSGGEKQRVLIARALAQDTDHLLLDEPTNHLDIGHQHSILALVRSLDVTTIAVLHDLNLAARYCDRLILLNQGTIIASGNPDQVLTPELLEPVYDVSVRRLREPDCIQLIFSQARATSGA